MLVSFEGIDGSGKSTQARLLVERLGKEGADPLLLREPGGTKVSEQIRTLLLDPSQEIEPFAELLLFPAARTQLVAERIKPALEAGRVVVLDRFFDSTTAYQGAGRNLKDVSWLQQFNLHVTGGLAPDRTYLIEVSPALALERRTGRTEPGAGSGDDRMEAAGAAFYERVAAGYAGLAEREPSRILRLDGAGDIEQLHARIWADFKAVHARRIGTRVSP